MLGRMGEHSNSDDVRVDDVVEDRLEDEKKEPVAAEPVDAGPEERVVEREPEVRPRSGAGKWLGLAALLLALVALAIAVINVVRPDLTEKFDKTPVTTAAAPAGPSQQQVADAKNRACEAYNSVGAAVTFRSGIELSPDPVQAEIVNINARQSFAVGNDYLLSHIDPATPPPLAGAIRNFAGDLQDLAVTALAGVPNDDPAQAGRLQNMVDLNGQINELCK
jgi:hypothetical protein